MCARYCTSSLTATMSEAQPLQAPLPWQRDEWQRLRGAVAAQRLHHGVLISGPGGIGKRLLADLLARTILCHAPLDAGPCGACRSCQLERAGSHPDFLRIVPEEPGKQIRIAQIRNELGDFVMRTASIAGSKVVLIDPADAMNHSTANCLLKSLEEPAGATHLLLLSDAPARLLATVRSRCEQLRLKPPTREQGLAWLQEHAEHEHAVDALELVSGRPLAALQLLRGDGLAQFDRAAQLMCRAADPRAWIPGLVSECADIELGALLEWIFVFLSGVSRSLAAPQSAPASLVRARAANAVVPAKTAAIHVARQLQRTLSAQRDASSTANPNRQLLLESLLIEWQIGHVD